jgi:hypothetical protein
MEPRIKKYECTPQLAGESAPEEFAARLEEGKSVILRAAQ